MDSLPPRTALWVVPVSDLGGVARHVLDVCRVGVPGWRVVVLCPAGALAEALDAQGAAVIRGNFGPASGPWRSGRTLRRVARRLRPAVIHSHLAYADLVCAAASTGLGTALVSTEHGIAPDDDLYQRSPLRGRLMRALHHARTRRTRLLIAVSESTADVMRTKWRPRAPIVVVRNGIDRGESPTRTPGLRLATLSRLAPEKGLGVVLEVVDRLAASEPSVTLTVAGDGPLADELRADVERRGLSARVTLPGHQSAHSVLADADVLIQLSRWENCSYTLLDACAAGLGVVATPVGGNPEILPPQCLVAASDPAGLVEAITRQGTQPQARPGLSSSWPDVSTMTAAVARYYAEVLA